MSIDIKHIAAYYAAMSDEELIRVTTLDAKGISPDIFPVIEQELVKRKLSNDLLNGVRAQNKVWEKEEVEKFAHQIRVLACPRCGSTAKHLNGTTITTLKGFLVVSVQDTAQVIACPDCLDKTNTRAIIITALLGWWVLPWGWYKTPVILYRNLRARRQHHIQEVNDTMYNYTLDHIGIIETCNGKQEKLQKLLQHYA